MAKASSIPPWAEVWGGETIAKFQADLEDDGPGGRYSGGFVAAESPLLGLRAEMKRDYGWGCKPVHIWCFAPLASWEPNRRDGHQFHTRVPADVSGDRSALLLAFYKVAEKGRRLVLSRAPGEALYHLFNGNQDRLKGAVRSLNERAKAAGVPLRYGEQTWESVEQWRELLGIPA